MKEGFLKERVLYVRRKIDKRLVICLYLNSKMKLNYFSGECCQKLSHSYQYRFSRNVDMYAFGEDW